MYLVHGIYNHLSVRTIESFSREKIGHVLQVKRDLREYYIRQVLRKTQTSRFFKMAHHFVFNKTIA